MTNVQTIGKEAPSFTDNEDAWRADEAAGLWAVADGAGGTGLYAGEWAGFLTQQIMDQPITSAEGLTHWLDGCWNDFFTRFQPRAADQFLAGQKFMAEGSAATLATLHQQNDTMHWMIYGDAVAMCFNPRTGTLQVAKPGLSQFETAPCLLNWNHPPHPAGFVSGQWQHILGNQYALLSDTLGQYVLMAHYVLGGQHDELDRLSARPTALGQRASHHLSFWPQRASLFGPLVWRPLWDALSTYDDFAAFTRKLRDRNLLGPDDYTAILIDP